MNSRQHSLQMEWEKEVGDWGIPGGGRFVTRGVGEWIRNKTSGLFSAEIVISIKPRAIQGGIIPNWDLGRKDWRASWSMKSLGK